jgi:predicted outer membrane repeat protein
MYIINTPGTAAAIFSNNTATKGGAAYMDFSLSPTSVSNHVSFSSYSRFEFNHALDAGGALYGVQVANQQPGFRVIIGR